MNQLPPFVLDVRPLFAAQIPPLAPILNAVSQLQPGQSMILIAPFQPAPLYQLLEQQGFTHHAEETGDGAWKITFTPSED